MTSETLSNRKVFSVRNALSQISVSRFLSIVITLGLMLFLLANIDWDSLGGMLARVSVFSLGAAFLSYFLLNFFRALRFRVLLSQPLPINMLLPITLYHNFLVRVLPFKLGELSYIFLMAARMNVRVEAGVSSLIGARLLELLVIVVVAAVGLLTSSELMVILGNSLLVLILASFFVCLVVLYFSGMLTRWGTGVLMRIVEALLHRRPGFADKLEDRLLRLASELDSLRRPRLFLGAFFFSIFTYSCSFATNYVLLQAVGLQVDMSVFIAIISIGMFASAFPFSISGFGVIELSWAFGLVTLAGYDMGAAGSIGLLLHGFQVIAASLYGLLGYLLMRWK